MQEEIKKTNITEKREGFIPNGVPNGGKGSSFGHSGPNLRNKENLPVYAKLEITEGKYEP